jgi:hypothetical protein
LVDGRVGLGLEVVSSHDWDKIGKVGGMNVGMGEREEVDGMEVVEVVEEGWEEGWGAQNNNGRFVELSEYHGGAQRGGIRVPEGYRGAGWDRFAMELAAFFRGKQESVVVQADSSRNGRQIHGRDSCNFTALPKPVIEASTNFKSTSELTSKTPRVQLDPAAPRPTRKFSFNWDPFPNTLRITKIVGEKR